MNCIVEIYIRKYFTDKMNWIAGGGFNKQKGSQNKFGKTCGSLLRLGLQSVWNGFWFRMLADQWLA